MTGGQTAYRVLVVDDDDDGVATWSLIFQFAGFDVRAASDGPSALRLVDDFRPHAIVLDIGLPKLNGCEVAQRVRANPACDGVVLIALTGYGEDADHARSREVGFDHHLVKPTDPDVLCQLLERHAASRHLIRP